MIPHFSMFGRDNCSRRYTIEGAILHDWILLVIAQKERPSLPLGRSYPIPPYTDGVDGKYVVIRLITTPVQGSWDPDSLVCICLVVSPSWDFDSRVSGPP